MAPYCKEGSGSEKYKVSPVGAVDQRVDFKDSEKEQNNVKQMNWKSELKKRVENISGLKIYRRLPFGLDQLHDIKYILSEFKMETVVDVGANIGQTANRVTKVFPEAKIFCVEPVADTFEKLKNNVSSSNISCYHLALGAENGSVDMVVPLDNANNTMNSFKTPNVKDTAEGFKKETIAVMTLDTFCKEQNIPVINYLKIDTEGFDLEVLKGATIMLKEKKIGFVQVEVGMNPDNLYHAAFTDLKNYLESFDYYLFGIYEQVQEWIIKKPILRVSNALFISKSLAYKFSVA
jgi:FkbM family methyltransferase